LSTETIAGVQDPGGQQRAARGPGARTLRIVCAVLAVLLVAAVAAAVWLGLKTHAASQERDDRAAAANVASQFALRVDTFDGKDMDSYGKSVQGLLTTKYKSEFEKQFAPFKQVYAKAQASSTGKVLMTAVGSYDPDSASVLVVHDGSVKSKLGSQVRHQRWAVDLVKVDGKWLVDDFNPVN
jgi:hypothetical protein